jgi:acyl carrier protein
MSKNEDRLKAVFADTLGIDKGLVVDDLKYNSISQWDSVAHMSLVGAVEDEFDIMLDTDDIIDLSSFQKAKEILSKYEIEF